MMQLLREWPPGFGGVERVAHSLAAELGGTVFSLQPVAGEPDALPVAYRRLSLSAAPCGRVLVPPPSRSLLQLLGARDPLVAHLPCPTVLVLVLLARLIHPKRRIWVYWHAFLEPGPGLATWFHQLYQSLACLSLRLFSVITTSPVLMEELAAAGVPQERLFCLPCALPASAEDRYGAVWHRRLQRQPLHSESPWVSAGGSVIVIGRLDSYKRIDWLIRAVAQAPAVSQLDVVGEGPLRSAWQQLASTLLTADQRAVFHGLVSEQRKAELLAAADLLVLPADRCNEAFGIVQLEAMACGVPAVAFDLPRSGMHWVSQLPVLPWSGRPGDLAALLQHLLSADDLQQQASREARQRYEQHFALSIWRQRLRQLGLAHG